ncbi:hypothetical protein RND71_015960 [Anisodus tanguticus]|uniref:Uncharacterized protein n=1 Tax=Anisodus tanguticus TaxID=243964 RepID=A0AAE1S7K4_9SOLA|nr:hypothetical protein RND71_015960 [Anisodus tanguticus]
MKTLLKRNVAAFAAIFWENSANSNSFPGVDPSSGNTSGSESGLRQSDESQNLKTQEMVNSVLSKFRDLSLDENSKQRIESATTFLDVVKREKKCLKKLGAWEKTENMLQEDITPEKRKISDLQQRMVETKNANIRAEKV